MQQTRESLDIAGNIVAERLWHPPQIWNISRIALINGIEYGYSTANPQTYQLWNTGQYHDDSPTDEPVAYDVHMCMAYRQHGRRQGLSVFDKVYIEGYILKNSSLNLAVRREYLGTPEIKELSGLSVTPTLFPPTDITSIGGDSIGEVPVGGGPVDITIMPKFRVIADVTQKNCFEYQLEIYSNVADSAWEILALGTNATQSPQQATFIRM